MKLVIVVPAYNEDKSIGNVLDSLRKLKLKSIKKEIIVVNDGSFDKTEKIAKNNKVTVVSHIINRGLGGALGTGLDFARSAGADIVVTFDADGQHSSKDIERIIKPILQKKADFVIGTRLYKTSKMPLDRKVLNRAASVLNYILWGTFVSDSQSGLRAISRHSLSKIEIRMNRMEVSSEFLKEARRNKLVVKEIPIKAIYTRYSLAKGQKNSNAFSILVKLLLYRLAN